MRVGWYLLLYGGLMGLMGLTSALVQPLTPLFTGFLPFDQILAASIALLAAPIGWLALRKSEWLPLASWVYLGFAIPAGIGSGYLGWLRWEHGGARFPEFAFIAPEWIRLVTAGSAALASLWCPLLVLLFLRSPAEKLTRAWQRGVGGYICVAALLTLLESIVFLSPLWHDWQQGQMVLRPYHLSEALTVIGDLAMLILGWRLVVGKGWLPMVAVVIVVKVAAAVAHRVLWLASVASGGAAAHWLKMNWAEAIGMVSSFAYNGLSALSPIILLLVFLLPAFPMRLTHYMRLWRMFRQRKLREVSW